MNLSGIIKDLKQKYIGVSVDKFFLISTMAHRLPFINPLYTIFTNTPDPATTMAETEQDLTTILKETAEAYLRCLCSQRFSNRQLLP